MNDEIELLLRKMGASMVGFAKLDGLYSKVNIENNSNDDSETALFDIPHYPIGISIAVAYPKEIIRNISEAPTMEYYDAYHDLNRRLDNMAINCAEYIKKLGYHAIGQTTTQVKQYGIFRTVMPHKTVAIHAGLGWIGKSALFITEPYGSAIRLTSVLTDAPLKTATPSLYTKCGSCMLCVNACPGNAISGRLWEKGSDRDDFFDANACRNKARELSAHFLNREITLCGKCIEVCPYTRRYI